MKMEINVLETPILYTVYDHPSDYPNEFVCRRFAIGSNGQQLVEIGEPFARAKTLDRLRAMLPLGLYPLPREEGDDPVIVETWI